MAEHSFYLASVGAQRYASQVSQFRGKYFFLVEAIEHQRQYVECSFNVC